MISSTRTDFTLRLTRPLSFVFVPSTQAANGNSPILVVQFLPPPPSVKNMTGAHPPWGLRWRSSTSFVLITVATGLFTDLFLYGLVVPVLPFLLHDRLSIPDNAIQSYSSGLLAAYAGVQLLCSVPAGWIADRTTSRQAPFLTGLAALLAATILLAVGQSIGVLVLARGLQGMSASVVWTIGLAMIRDTVGPHNLGKAIGTVS